MILTFYLIIFYLDFFLSKNGVYVRYNPRVVSGGLRACVDYSIINNINNTLIILEFNKY